MESLSQSTVWSRDFLLHGVKLCEGLGGGAASPQPRPISPSSFPRPGTYCCGPVPVRAIKEGDLSTKYDAPFVFAEVNADVVDWIRQEDGSLHKSVNRSLVVGLKISTKSVGRDEREDITHNYKYPEGRRPAPRSLNPASQKSSPLYQPSGPVCGGCVCVFYLAACIQQ